MTSQTRRNICVATAVIVAFAAAVTVRVVFDETFSPRIFHRVLIEESRSKEKCEAVANRIFVTTDLGSECVAYFVSKGFETRRQAVVFFGGDVSKQQYVSSGLLEGDLAERKKLLQLWADRLRVRYVYVSRLGLQGSSGSHGDRRQPKETLVMNAVVDGLKARLGLDDLALAGQSGGATIAAGLLTLGRKDVQCAVLGSGATEAVEFEYDSLTKHGYHTIKAVLAWRIYDPSAHLATIAQREDRRIFALGDPRDSIVAFKSQSQFVDALKASGHAAKLIEVEGKGSQHHGVEQFSLPVAGACLNGVTDESIVWAVALERSASRQQQASVQPGWQYRELKPAAAGTKPSAPRTLPAVRPFAVAANDNRDCSVGKAGPQVARIAACTNILKSNPSSFHALANRGVAYNATGEYAKALADLNAAFKHVHVGALAGLYLERGTAHEGLGNHKLAIADFNEAIGWDPSLVVAYFGRATAYDAMGQGELAKADLDKAIQLDRNLVAALSMQRGYAMRSARHYDEAIVAFNRVINLRPDWPLAYFGRAASYQEKGDSKLAVADYRKCLEFNATTELVRQRQQLAKEQLEKLNEG